jgi:hypothetical protein
VFRPDAVFAKPEIYEALEEQGLKCPFGFRSGRVRLSSKWWN